MEESYQSTHPDYSSCHEKLLHEFRAKDDAPQPFYRTHRIAVSYIAGLLLLLMTVLVALGATGNLSSTQQPQPVVDPGTATSMDMLGGVGDTLAGMQPRDV